MPVKDNKTGAIYTDEKFLSAFPVGKNLNSWGDKITSDKIEEVVLEVSYSILDVDPADAWDAIALENDYHRFTYFE